MTLKMKNIASAIVLTFFLLLAGGSISSSEEILIWLIPGSIIGIIASIITNKIEKRKELEKKEKELEKKEKAQKLEIQREQKKQLLIDKFGEYSKIISYNFDSFIIINEAESFILLNNNKYLFNEIIDFTVSDNETIIYSPTISETKTSTGSMIGRAVVGGVLTGGVGAVVGGATAKKQTVTEASTGTIKHNYKVIVTVNNISNPNETLHVGTSDSEINEISSLLKVIINRNEQLNL